MSEVKVSDGPIQVNSVDVLLERDSVCVLAIDCKQKRPSQDAGIDSDGSLYIYLGIDEDEPTLGVLAGSDPHAVTTIEIADLPIGPWRVFLEWGSFGPTVALVKDIRSVGRIYPS